MMAVSATNSSIGGLPRRLVDDGIIEESVLLEAMESAKKERQSIVTYLVARNLADARSIAVVASHEFGVPLLDMEAFEADIEIIKLVDEKLLGKHRVLPLYRRGKRLFLAVSDPTNLFAIDEIRFQTGLSVDTVVVQEDLLAERVARALEATGPAIFKTVHAHPTLSEAIMESAALAYDECVNF